MQDQLLVHDRTYTHVKERELTKVNLTVTYSTTTDPVTHQISFTAVADLYPEDTDFALTIDGCKLSNKSHTDLVPQLLDIYDFEDYVLDIHPSHFGSNITTQLLLPTKQTT